jgi:hypothetical protein
MVKTEINLSASHTAVRWMASLTLLVILIATGCSGDSRVSKVSGTVTLDGEPIGKAAVAFVPVDGGRPAFGITDADGEYELTTFASGDGALIGSHVVTITPADDEPEVSAQDISDGEDDSLNSVVAEFKPKKRPKRRSRIPELYSDQDTSGLAFDVQQGKENIADFSLSLKP